MTTVASTERPDSREAPVTPPRTVIEPPIGWQFVNARELWAARELIFFLSWRDVKVRYKQTALGAAWALLQPLMMMIVFSIFFGRLARIPSGSVPYPLFVLAGLLPWTFFTTAVTAAGNSVVGSERLITKIYFPRLAVPLASVGASVVDFLVATALLAVLMAWYGVAPGPGILIAPVIFALIATLALGLGTILAALNVTYRDFKYMIPFMLQIGMFATPTVYMDPSAAAPGRYAWLLALNPMTSLIAAFRASVLGGRIGGGPLVLASGIAILMLVGGCLYFRKVEDSFADVI